MRTIILSFFVLTIMTSLTSSSLLFPALEKYIQSREKEFDQIPSDRIEKLKQLAAFIQKNKDHGDTTHLVFICTHNSRRSHLGQLWTAVAAHYFNLSSYISTGSGGTEATAFNPRAVASLQRAGFNIFNPGGANPNYQVKFSSNVPALSCFSKRYDHPVNAHKPLGAVMVCSQADQACPIVPGADFRIAIPYEDPKAFDNTPDETKAYDERSRQIAREMIYMVSLIK